LWSTLIASKILILDKQKIDLFYGYEILGVPAARFLSLIFRLPMVSRFQGTILFPLLDNPLGLARHWQHVLAYKIKSPLVIMTNDGTQGDRVLQRFHVDPERVLFLMNGVDKDLCKDSTKDLPEMEALPVGISNMRVILTVSRLIRWKRVDRAIRAFAQLVKRGEDVILIIVGDGPERGNLERLARELGVAQLVIFVGAVSRDQIGRYYQMGDIFLSLYDLSNVGNPLIEAMICGKPIIALNTGDTNTVIENGLNGLLIDPDALDDLPGMLAELLKDPDLRGKLAVNAQAYASAHFKTWEERMEIEFTGVEQLIRGK
jgi:glycosyltransferase involved in cell wall biosynthesis